MKYKARLKLIPILSKLGRKSGSTWQQLGDKYGREVMIAQAAEILNSSEEFAADDPDKNLDVIFLTMIGGHGYNTSVDIVLGLALKARGLSLIHI